MYKDFSDIYSELADPEFSGIKTEISERDAEQIYNDEFFESPGAFGKKARQYCDRVRVYRYLRAKYYAQREKNRSVKAAHYDRIGKSSTRTTDAMTKDTVKLESSREKCAESRAALVQLMVLLIREINKAPDARLRLILMYRIIDLREWRDISFELYGTSEKYDGVRKAFNRYLEARENGEHKQ